MREKRRKEEKGGKQNVSIISICMFLHKTLQNPQNFTTDHRV